MCYYDGQLLGVQPPVKPMSVEKIWVPVLHLGFDQVDQLDELRGGEGVPAWNIEQCYRCFRTRISQFNIHGHGR